MSDSDDDGSFMSLPTAASLQRQSLTSELSNKNTSNQQHLIQFCRDSEALAHCLLPQQQSVQQRLCEQGLGEDERVSGVEEEQQLIAQTNGERSYSKLVSPDEKLTTRLRAKVEELEVKLLDRTREVERLRSELGATDLEKQLELLVVENEQLKQQLKSWRCLEPHNIDAAAKTCNCSHCPYSQDAEKMRRELLHSKSQSQQRERSLADLEQDMPRKSPRVDSLMWQLHDSTHQQEDYGQWQGEAEHKPTLRSKQCEQELARQGAAPPRVEFVTQTVKADPTDSHRALAEVQTKNVALQEQVSGQRQLLRELQTQLHESQRNCAQLRTQILVYEEELQRAQGQLEVEMQNLEEEKNKVIEEAFMRAESQMKAVHENLAGVRINLMSLQPALRTLTCDYNSLKRQVQHFPYMLDKAITEAKHEICQVISEVSSTNQELLLKYKKEMNLRKKCHNELVRLKGNIRVFCRVRPISQDEKDAADARILLSFDSDDDSILYLSSKGKVMTFELDKVFPPQATQEEVFKEVQSLVTSCIDGYNVCIFAYGQTGSGKTYTMEGETDNPGINQRALHLLFSEVREKAPDWNYKIKVSMVEIYNETLRNLLSESSSAKLDIRMKPDGSGQLYVPELTEFPVQSLVDIKQVFELGRMNRATACTNLNEHSSRSHALLIITVCGLNITTGDRTQGKLNLVDLAGSERISKSGAEGTRLREAQCINKSLAALGDVINALRSKHPHVPFRNSRLTYLLQDSLSGDSKTLMMVQVSPSPSNTSESLCSLKFAQRVRSLELSSASAASRKHENLSTPSSPTHDHTEVDSPPVTPIPLPISRASSAGTTLSSTSRTSSGSRRRSQSQVPTDIHIDKAFSLLRDGEQDN
ncbi:kinesin-like protein KIFC3 isoform X3 [Cynoglossus semilaevis]|nr:kinesin-like protein KIFC3 isoform X3 [Cynoglossus semilaevis]XP_008308088.1 kinesin-like protein KIFC3 isoform X3 [Cynoglossus semilaevis]